MNGLAMGLDILALLYAALVSSSALFWLIIHVGHTWWRRLGAGSLWVALPLWGGRRGYLFAPAPTTNRTSWTTRSNLGRGRDTPGFGCLD